MAPARDAFAGFIRDFTFKAPQIPVYTNTTGKSVSDPEEIKAALVKQIVSPVRFEECLRNAAADNGIRDFIEFGPGKVLAGLARRTDRELNVTSVSEYGEIPV